MPSSRKDPFNCYEQQELQSDKPLVILSVKSISFQS